jgi:uncharacterized cupredoxin-like copper-binding protein
LTYRKGSLALAVSVASSLGLIPSAFGATAGSATAHVLAPKPTVVNVTAGSPSELAFALSKFSNLPVGKFMFKVTNKGAIAHDFKVCSAPFVGTIVFSCAGKATPTIQPGKSAVLNLTLAKGKYEYLCTVPGHASAGMKGFFGVGVKVATATTTPVGSPKPTPPPTSTGTTATTTTAAATCANPQTSSVTVSMFEFGYTATPSTVPCGAITFTVNNTGNTDHDFVIEGLIGSNGRTNLLAAGQSQTITTTLSPGTWTYYCSVPTHRALGMEGKLIVTP